MKFTIKIAFIILSLFTFNTAFAQNMKAPVSFKLKNGVTVIVAQNAGMGKIYSRLTIEHPQGVPQHRAAKAFEGFLNSKANTYQNNTVDGSETPKVSLALAEANTATNVAEFEQAFQFVSANLTNPELSKQTFDGIQENAELADLTLNDVKAFYSNHFNPAHTFITIAGDIDVATAKAMVTKAFGNWKAEAADLSK